MHDPYLALEVALDRHHELIAEADRARLLTAARRRRRADRRGANGRRAGRRRSSAGAEADPATGEGADGSLTPCGPRAAAPAR